MEHNRRYDDTHPSRKEVIKGWVFLLAFGFIMTGILILIAINKGVL